MLNFPRPLSTCIGASEAKARWVRRNKGLSWDGGNVKKPGIGTDSIRASFLDRRPTLEDRTTAADVAPAISKYYNQYYPELGADEHGESCVAPGYWLIH